MGDAMPLYNQWYFQGQLVSNRIQLDLEDGDMFVMSEKAVGYDWLQRNVPTLRHASGADKYTVLEGDKNPVSIVGEDDKSTVVLKEEEKKEVSPSPKKLKLVIVFIVSLSVLLDILYNLLFHFF